MSKYMNNVAYLQDFDFDDSGNLVNPKIPKNVPVVIMVQANFCGYCTQAKQAFQEFADKTQGNVFCATIQGDGQEEGEPELAKRLQTIDPNFRGFPTYFLYKGGRYVKTGDTRSVPELVEFANS